MGDFVAPKKLWERARHVGQDVGSKSIEKQSNLHIIFSLCIESSPEEAYQLETTDSKSWQCPSTLKQYRLPVHFSSVNQSIRSIAAQDIWSAHSQWQWMLKRQIMLD